MRLLQLFLVSMLWASSAWGQERPDKIHDISGVWHSSTGATVRVLPYVYAPHKPFTIVAEFHKGRRLRYQAEWLIGFRQQFRYLTPDGDEVMGVVDRDGSNVQLGNGGHWKAWWRR